MTNENGSWRARALTLGEFMDMAEDILDERPEAADFPLRTRGMYVTDLGLGVGVEEIDLVTLPEHELDTDE